MTAIGERFILKLCARSWLFSTPPAATVKMTYRREQPAGADPYATVMVSAVVSAMLPGLTATVMVGEVGVDARRMVQALPFESVTPDTAGGDVPPVLTTMRACAPPAPADARRPHRCRQHRPVAAPDRAKNRERDEPGPRIVMAIRAQALQQAQRRHRH